MAGARDRIGQGRVERVRAHVRANLHRDLSLDALADVAAPSRFHGHRVWRAATGETAAGTVRRERLNRAAVLVGVTAMPLGAVARAVGLSGADALGRAFRAAWGPTAREARAPPRAAGPQRAGPRHRGETATTDVLIREHAPAELAALPHRAPCPGIGRIFGARDARLRATGVASAGPAVALCCDMPGVTPDEDLRAHSGVVVAPGAALPPGLDRVALAGGRVAVLAHRGPHEGIPGAWDALDRWLGSSPEEAAADAPPYERCLNDMGAVPPEALLTETCVPLRG